MRYVITPTPGKEAELQSILDAAKKAGILSDWDVNIDGGVPVDSVRSNDHPQEPGDGEHRCVDCEDVFPLTALWHTTPPLGSPEPHIYQCTGCRRYMIEMALKGHAAAIEAKSSTDPRRSAA